MIQVSIAFNCCQCHFVFIFWWLLKEIWILNLVSIFKYKEQSRWLFSYFGPQVYPMGCMVITLVGPSVCVSLLKYFRASSLFFLKLWMKLHVNKVKKWHGRNFEKILMQGLRGIKSIGVFRHFLRNQSLKVSNFLHNGKGQ